MSQSPSLTRKIGMAFALATIASLCFVVSGCRVGYPFRGPGYDADRGVVHRNAEQQVLVVVTRGDVKNGRAKEFANDLRAVMDTMDEHEGLIGYAARRELFGPRVWTISVWTDRASMGRFVYSDAHGKAMASATLAPDSFITATALLDTSMIPLSWAEAERMLDERATQE